MEKKDFTLLRQISMSACETFLSPLSLMLDSSRKSDASLSNHDPRTAVQLRTALKRLKEIMEGKSQVCTPKMTRPFLSQMYIFFSHSYIVAGIEKIELLWNEVECKTPAGLWSSCFADVSSSKDSDLKQYWMPDSQCKECYDCNEKFTTFRRRHHCRLCGQIFCSRCCNQEIPGKFMGYTGRWCTSIRLSDGDDIWRKLKGHLTYFMDYRAHLDIWSTCIPLQ